jgi:hypothetical protein
MHTNVTVKSPYNIVMGQNNDLALDTFEHRPPARLVRKYTVIDHDAVPFPSYGSRVFSTKYYKSRSI